MIRAHYPRGRFILRSLAACCWLAAASFVEAAPEIPGEDQARPVAIVGATLHPVSGPAIEGGTILFDGGKIVAVGKDVAIPDGAERIDAAGKHVYPGLIDAFTNLGLVEIDAVRATLDQNEVGDINPNVSARLAFNPDSELIPVARSGGVLNVVAAPTGGLFAGLASVMQLDGWTHEDMTLRADVGSVINWPAMAPNFTPFSEQSADEQLHRRDLALAAIRATLADARAYRTARQAAGSGAAGNGAVAPHDTRLEGLMPVLDGTRPLFVRADELQQIQAAAAFAGEEKLKLVIVGGYDALACVELHKRSDTPVIVTGVHRLPQRTDDAYDAAFTLPGELHRAGIRFCIALGDASSNLRNLPHHAGTAAAHGLPADEALKAITSNAASILGVGDRIGTLEAGKDATLIVTDGDVLEVVTRVESAYIQGRRVDLSDRHKRLWNKYREKYRRKKAAP
jgi:imidazolonepropionase-like amidohydrolase